MVTKGKPYLLRVEGTGVVARLVGFDEAALPRLEGLAIELAEDDGLTAPDYTIRLDGVVPSRAGPPPRGRALRPFSRYLRGPARDQLVLRGGTVRISPGAREARLVLRSASKAGAVPWRGEAVLTAVQHALAFRGWATLHAAAFELDGVGVLAVGPTHAGKSTLCMAALAAGGRVVSDDWLAVGRPESEDAVVAAPLRRDIWLREGSLEIIRGVVGERPEAVGYRGEDRWRLGRTEQPQLFADSVKPRVLLQLVRDRRLSGFRLEPSTAAEGLARLLNATSPLFVSGRYGEERTRLVPTMTEVVNQARSYQVRMGRKLLSEPGGTITGLLETIVTSQG